MVPEIRGQVRTDFDIVAQDAIEHALRFANEVIEIERPWVHNLLAAEGQQLLCKLGALFAGVMDCGETFAEGIVGLHLAKNPIGVAINYGEEIVEVVSDAAGQPAQALHFLRLNNLFLETFPVGDIEERDDDARPIVAGRIHNRNNHIH